MCSLNWYVAKLSHPQTVVATAPTKCVGKPPFWTLRIFSNFLPSLIWDVKKNISHCLISVSSFKEEADCSKISSSYEPVFKKYTVCPVLVQFQLIFYPGIHSTVKLEKWALSRKVYCVLETWMNENILLIMSVLMLVRGALSHRRVYVPWSDVTM